MALCKPEMFCMKLDQYVKRSKEVHLTLLYIHITPSLLLVLLYSYTMCYLLGILLPLTLTQVLAPKLPRH